MRRLALSTDEISETDRFAYWREEVSARLVGVSSERNTDQERPFRAKVRGAISESVIRLRYRADGHPVFRRPSDIARVGWDDHFMLCREIGAGAWFDYDRQEFATRSGDLTVADPRIPFATQVRTDYDFDLWLFPRKLLDPHLAVSQRPRSLVLTGETGLGGMVKTYLNAFGAQFDRLDEREAGLLADNFCRLLAAACGANAGDQRDAIRAARLAEVQRYVDLHLADPRLSPEKAAGALKMSVRQLHLLFEPSGSSFSQYVLRRRLEECRAALADAERSVTDIALAWGFNSLATFYRTFREAFGVTPSELRAALKPGVGCAD
jgi:AraC-like DNA-binding protein